MKTMTRPQKMPFFEDDSLQEVTYVTFYTGDLRRYTACRADS